MEPHNNNREEIISVIATDGSVVEFITCVKEMEEGYLHQNVGLETPDEELDLDYIKGQGVNQEIEYALSNSLGFGGHNACLLIKKFNA